MKHDTTHYRSSPTHFTSTDIHTARHSRVGESYCDTQCPTSQSDYLCRGAVTDGPTDLEVGEDRVVESGQQVEGAPHRQHCLELVDRPLPVGGEAHAPHLHQHLQVEEDGEADLATSGHRDVCTQPYRVGMLVTVRRMCTQFDGAPLCFAFTACPGQKYTHVLFNIFYT